MAEHRKNHSDHFKVGSRAAEDRSAAQASKRALAAQAAEARRHAGDRTILGVAPPEQHRKQPSPELVHRPTPRRPSATRRARTRLEWLLHLAAYPVALYRLARGLFGVAVASLRGRVAE